MSPSKVDGTEHQGDSSTQRIEFPHQNGPPSVFLAVLREASTSGGCGSCPSAAESSFQGAQTVGPAERTEKKQRPVLAGGQFGRPGLGRNHDGRAGRPLSPHPPEHPTVGLVAQGGAHHDQIGGAGQQIARKVTGSIKMQKARPGMALQGTFHLPDVRPVGSHHDDGQTTSRMNLGIQLSAPRIHHNHSNITAIRWLNRRFPRGSDSIVQFTCQESTPVMLRVARLITPI